jgi:23S rRNA pseudouridine1911/1915/1917 synthase
MFEEQNPSTSRSGEPPHAPDSGLLAPGSLPISIEVETAAGKERLDRFLANRLRHLSRSRIQSLIESRHILVNGIACRASQTVRLGDRISVVEPEPEPIDLLSEEIPLQILFEDEHLVVVNKPAGMVVHPGAGVQKGTLVNALLHHVQNLSGIGGQLRPGVVHRLDKETSGCLVVAKHDVAHLRLSRQFAGRKVRKFYLAFCSGKFTRLSGEINAPIGRHPVHRQKMAIVERGRSARTHFEVILQESDRALVLCQIFTGRTHQIRVHMQSNGHPVLGDKIYGKPNAQYPRQLLHAWRLGFFHPENENWLEFEAAIPDDFREFGADEYAVVRARDRIDNRASENDGRSS